MTDELLIFDDGPVEKPAHSLSMMDTMSIVDNRGRLRCPRCGKFRSSMDQFKKGGCHRFGAAIVCLTPYCDLCEKKWSEQE